MTKHSFSHLTAEEHLSESPLVKGARRDALLSLQRVLPSLRSRPRVADPDAALVEFLQSTYEAAVTHAHWDRASLKRKAGSA